MRRLFPICGLLGVCLLNVAQAKPAKRRPPRRPPAASVPAPGPDELTEQAAPDEGGGRDEKASEAPPPDAARAVAAPKLVEEGVGSASTSAPSPAPDLRKLRADYDRLRDALFRTRSRAEIVQEGVYHARLGARLHWKAAPDYTIRHAEVRLDGGTIWDSGDKPVTDDVLTIADRPCKPGPHAVTLRLEIRPGTKKKGKDVEGLGYVTEQTFAIVVPDGKRTTVAFTGDEDGSLPEYQPELDVELETEPLK